jgi:hypothetical protein
MEGGSVWGRFQLPAILGSILHNEEQPDRLCSACGPVAPATDAGKYALSQSNSERNFLEKIFEIFMKKLFERLYEGSIRETATRNHPRDFMKKLSKDIHEETIRETS